MPEDTLPFAPKFQLIDIHYQIRKLLIFHQLNGTFSAGINAIIGANGCGKSTLLRIISGICQPQRGQVLLNEQNIYHVSLQKTSIGYVPSQPFLYPHLTLVENLLFVAKLKRLPKQAIYPRLNEILTNWHLDAYQKCLFGKLSDGLQKRAMIASALLAAPTLLVLDEPCALLDPMQRQQLWELLAKLSLNGQLIILTSHHPHEIAPFSPHLFLLEQGQLQRLKNKEFSRLLWQTPALPRHEQLA